EPVEGFDVLSAIAEIERAGAVRHAPAMGRAATGPRAARAGVGAGGGGNHRDHPERERPECDPVGAPERSVSRPSPGSLRRLMPAVFAFRPLTGDPFVHSLFRSLTGLADGLAPKEKALRGIACDSPQ